MPSLTYDQWIAAICVWREARGETDLAMQGVYHVILNRVKDPRWPNTAAEVVLQPKQFSCFLAGDPNVVRFPLPKQKADWAAFQRVLAIVETPGADPTGGATNYESCPDDQEPGWAKNPIARIGSFEFYVT
jgi:spore germination cell wall hydrolase CwlJ-like protein